MGSQILVIAEQQRLQRIFDGMAEAQGRGLVVVAGLVDAADQIELEVPGLILVQDRLSGLSGELIVRHLRKRLQGETTLIVLASDSAEALENCDENLHVLDPSLPDQELVRQLERLVVRMPRLQPEFPEEALQAQKEADETVQAAADMEMSVVIPKPPLEFTPEPAPEPVSVTASETNDETPEILVNEVPPGVASRFEAELETELARRESPVTAGPVANGTEPALTVAEMLTAADQSESMQAAWVGKKIGAGLVLLLVLAVAVWIWQQPDVKQPPKVQPVKPPASVKQSVVVSPTAETPAITTVPAVTSPPQAVPIVPDTPLPRFISAAKAVLDPVYGRDHAGWQRYLTATLEFKLFRDAGKLKALQVLDRAGEGLPTRLFTSAMEELTKVRDYQTEGREVKGEYLVKKGRLASGAKIIIYKDKQDKVLHGFVIYFN